MIPSTSELTNFLEISNTSNLSQAAKNLCISQSALSRSIQQLENRIGTELFIRHKKGMTLTHAGKKMLLHVKPLFQYWQNTKLQTIASHQNVEGHIKIGCHSTVGMFIHEIVAELLDSYPMLDIELCHHHSDIITQQVIDLNIDIGIVTNPIEYPDLIIRNICSTDTTFYHVIGTHKNLSTTDSTLIYHPDSQNVSLLLQKCKAENILFNRFLKVNNYEVIANLAANGCGIGLLPSCFVEKLYNKKLVRMPNMPAVSNKLQLIHRKEYVNVQAIKTVIDTIKKWSIDGVKHLDAV